MTRHPGDDREFAWSPDGRKIAFVSDRDRSPDGFSEVYVVNADGSGERRLTQDARSDSSPAWSPDGRKIAFASNDGIYVMNADGSEQRALTRTPGTDKLVARPVWSPHGRKIAFISVSDGQSEEVYVMNADGSGKWNLTRNPAADGEPAWSPDGRKLAFVSDRDSDPGLRLPNSEVYVVNADGSGKRRLTHNTAHDGEPAWSPDGQKIAFLSMRDGNGEVYVMNADGSEQRNVSNNPKAFDGLLAWSPGQKKK